MRMCDAMWAVMAPTLPRCPGLDGPCGNVRKYDPRAGHLPRSYGGAHGSLREGRTGAGDRRAGCAEEGRWARCCRRPQPRWIFLQS
jgi:hypothetical protein